MRLTTVVTSLASVFLLASAANGAETPWHASWKNPVNRILYRIAKCETGGKPGQNGRPDWDHRSRDYGGGLGFYHRTWEHYRHYVTPKPGPRSWEASPAEQYAVARVLVRLWPNYSSWPTCSARLGLR